MSRAIVIHEAAVSEYRQFWAWLYTQPVIEREPLRIIFAEMLESALELEEAA